MNMMKGKLRRRNRRVCPNTSFNKCRRKCTELSASRTGVCVCGYPFRIWKSIYQCSTNSKHTDNKTARSLKTGLLDPELNLRNSTSKLSALNPSTLPPPRYIPLSARRHPKGLQVLAHRYFLGDSKPRWASSDE